MDSNEIEEILEVEDIDKIGVVNLEDCKGTPLYKKAAELLPGAKSVIILAMELMPEAVKFLSPRRTQGETAMDDLYYRNAEIVSGHLDWEAYKTVRRLHRHGYKGLFLTAANSPSDSRFIEPAFPYKKAAELAGMGTTGWHSMMLTPEFGPRVRLACVITDALLPPTEPGEPYDPCPACGGACIKVCPVDAIRKPEDEDTNTVNKYACANYLNAAGGCSQCLKVCPAGK